MRKLILTCLIGIVSSYCTASYARDIECFVGALAVEQETGISFVYNNKVLFKEDKHKLTALPFLGCGIRFDF
jgi:hypothetical protein